LFVQVLGIAESIKNTLPEIIDYDATVKILSVDPSPLNVVLLQEVWLSRNSAILLAEPSSLTKSNQENLFCL